MRAKAATFLCLVPESARSFCLAPHASHGTNSRYCSSRIPCRASPAFSQCPPSSSSSATASGLRRRRERSLPRVERAGAHDHRSSDARSPSSMDPGQRVSRALNRALGNVLATGDMFGSVSKGVSDDDAFGRHWSSKIDHGVGDQAKEEDREEEQEEDEDEDGDYGGGDSRAQQDAADMLSGKNPLSLKKFGQRRSANRLLRAKTEASAAVVVDGPFRELQAYMTLPVSEYSLLDSSVIRRVSESSFRFQVPLKELVGLDFTPTMEVEVELDPQAKAVVFRSVRSTLYGNVGKPGEEANTNPWPEAATSKVEYFRVAFDARLRWVDGDASLAPRQRGRGGFTGDFTRRPRPAPPAAGAGPTGEATGRAAAASAADVVGDTGDPSGGDSAPPAPLPAGEARRPKTEVLPEKAGPATVFCDTEIKVQVLLPPPYNTLLPWRLVRALLGKLLSTIVAYVLPRFLELLADDFYGWQSGARRAAATAGETSRTLLGAKDNSGSGSERERGGGRGGGGLGSAAAPQAGGAGQDAPVAGERDDGGARRRGGGGGGRRYDENSSSNNNNRRNPVVGGLQRLRNVRGPGGDRARTRAVTTSADAGEVAAVAAAAAAPSSAVTMQPAAQNASANQVSKAVVQEDLSDWAAPSVPSGGVSGDGFNFEVSVEDVREEGEGGDEPRQQRRRRGWMGGGNQDGDGGDGGSGGVSGGGGGQINWWG